MAGAAHILVLNAGSSSIKAAVFDAAFAQTLSASVSGIGTARMGALRIDAGPEVPQPMPDHAAGLKALLDGLAEHGVRSADLRAAAHRVVHGGAAMTAPCQITPEVRAQIAACVPLAPLHNPNNLAGIDAVAALAPDLPQFASFDTAFHTTNPEVALRYALPDRPETAGLRRYGFHGTSFAALVRRLPDHSHAPLPARLLALHLGNGASLCAIRDGASVATTMGYSPLSGLTMGTRAGEIDGNAVLRLVADIGAEATHRLLNDESGLLGLSGISADMRRLRADGSDRALHAIDHFAYWVIRQSGAMIAAMGGLDAIAFTGGIGENDTDMRQRITDGLRWAGPVPVHVVPAAEEEQIARDAASLLGPHT